MLFCRRRHKVHYAANLMSVTPKPAWGWVQALLHSVYDQPGSDSVHVQFVRVLDAWRRSCRRSPRNWTPPAPTP
jgi:transposase-like protein